MMYSNRKDFNKKQVTFSVRKSNWSFSEQYTVTLWLAEPKYFIDVLEKFLYAYENLSVYFQAPFNGSAIDLTTFELIEVVYTVRYDYATESTKPLVLQELPLKVLGNLIEALNTI